MGAAEEVAEAVGAAGTEETAATTTAPVGMIADPLPHAETTAAHARHQAAPAVEWLRGLAPRPIINIIIIQ